MSKTALFIGTFDTKGSEYRYVHDLVIEHGFNVITMNIGVMGPTIDIREDISSDNVAAAAGESLASLRSKGDRGWAMSVMSAGAQRLVDELYKQNMFDAVFGMGGTGGTSVVSAAMRTLPIGIPKVLISTAASGDTRNIVGTKDIVLIPSVVDVAGVNRISSIIYTQAAGVLCGLLEQTFDTQTMNTDRPIIAVTMFGNTTQCVEKCRQLLTENGYEVLVFHCTGTGGKTMESLVEEGLIQAVLDITTTEWADELCGGVFSAGPTRLEAPGRCGIPHLIVPGCVDMVNFGPRETVPEKYQSRKFHVWNPQVTLMRTTPEENQEMGRIFAKKANAARGPMRFLLPTRGVSILDSVGNDFWWPEADQLMFASIKSNVSSHVLVEEADLNINDSAFAELAVQRLLTMIREMGVSNE